MHSLMQSHYDFNSFFVDFFLCIFAIFFSLDSSDISYIEGENSVSYFNFYDKTLYVHFFFIIIWNYIIYLSNINKY